LTSAVADKELSAEEIKKIRQLLDERAKGGKS